MRDAAAVLIGLLLLVGAVAGWKFWEIHPFISVIVGIVGLSLVGNAVSREHKSVVFEKDSD